MTALAYHRAAVARYDAAARALEEKRRVELARGNTAAVSIAIENRDIARVLHLGALADALAAGLVLS